MSLFQNYPLIAAFCAIFFAQIIKFPIAYLTKKQGAQLSLMTSTGGMPSSHSAAVTSLITALIVEFGPASPWVAIGAVFGVIVMFDAMGVRRQSGEQGILISQLYQEQLREEKTEVNHFEIADDEVDRIFDFEANKKLIIKKYLGHKPIEVFGGALTGILVALVVRMFY